MAASTMTGEKRAAALHALILAALTLPRLRAEAVTIAFDPDGALRLAAVVNGSADHARNAAEIMRAALKGQGLRALGGWGFDLARADLEPGQHRLAFLCPIPA